MLCLILLWFVCTCTCTKTFPKTSPHGEGTFPTSSCITRYLYVQSFQISRGTCVAPWVNDTLWFHLPIVDYCIMQFDTFFCYKDIRSKAFFTMTTLLMLLLGNRTFLPWHEWWYGFLSLVGVSCVSAFHPNRWGTLGPPPGMENHTTTRGREGISFTI